MKRRELIKLGAAATAGVAGSQLLTGCGNNQSKAAGSMASSGASAKARVVVVGGGIGGVSAAQAVKKADPAIEVTVIERNKFYSTCFGSNWVLSDKFKMSEITSNYNKMSAKHKINMVFDEVVGVDPVKQTVSLANGKPMAYDRLIVSPGISFRWDTIEGHDESTSNLVPHAWKAGYQTMILKEQIDDMKDGGTIVMSCPPNPFRCPPGPPERASQIAAYLKREKPKSKLIILDEKNKFSKKGLFEMGWEMHYGYNTDNAIIEWIPKQDGGSVKAVDPHKKTLTTADGEVIKADVINYIPAQKANMTAVKLGLVNDKGWCPVDQQTFESTMVKNVHVLGDASISSPMPKSGFAANSQGAVCGKAVAALLNGQETNASANLGNQCYSLITNDHGISVAAGYKIKDRKITKTNGGLFPKDHTAKAFKAESQAAVGWYYSIAGVLFN